MIPSSVDPYDTSLAWWETDCVRYGLSHTPVRSRLMALMGSHIVRLTDRKYMMQLTSKLQEDYEARQRARIEWRKLKPASIVPDLTESPSRKTLRRRRRRRRRCASPSKDDGVAAVKCKQLPQLLLSADDSRPPLRS